MKKKIECPKCQGTLKVWLDIDASLSFSVSKTGKLSKRAIEDNQQSDGRCGLECQDCSWKIHGADVEPGPMLQIIESANEQWQGLQLSVTRIKN